MTDQPTRRRLMYGGDVNPEQWSAETFDEDLDLMRRAGVTLVTLGVFSWAAIEPSPGEFDFDWMDLAIRRYADAGIGVDLATPTAAPPIWLHRAHPEILPVSRTGQRFAQGGRLGWCASHPVWREHAARIVGALARRYGADPAIRLWHIGNEFGGGNRHCYCDESAAAFQRWLADRYGDVATLNATWGTAFWGHRYRSFEEVLPPRDSETVGRGNPGLVLDFDRFSSDALRSQLLMERGIIREHAPAVPITTNFMIGRGPHPVDYAEWAGDVDIVSTDHYLIAADPDRAHDAVFAADRTRGVSPDRPWMLMETAAGAVSWQPVNRPPEPGEVRSAALSHVARGADGILFFQWRQSVAGAEQFHSAMVPHAGADSRVFAEVAELGRTLEAIGEVAGSTVVPAEVAIIVDDISAWAWESGPKPVGSLRIGDDAVRIHRRLWTAGIRCDVLPIGADLGGYRVVIAPGVFVLPAATAASLHEVVDRGDRVLVTRLTGIVDEANTVVGGGYPGLLRALLGVVVEEFVPLLPTDRVAIDRGETVDAWAERLRVVDAEVDSWYSADSSSAIVAGRAAVTVRTTPSGGRAWYCSANLGEPGLDALLERVLDGAVERATPGLDLVTRERDGTVYAFAHNHGETAVTVPVVGIDLIRGGAVDHPTLRPGEHVVVTATR